MKLSLDEQEGVMKEFADPVEFIKGYVDVYEKQRGVPVKVYLEDISYYERFEPMFLDLVLKRALSEGSSDLNFPEVEELLHAFCGKEFYDERFYLESTLVLIKGIAILVDRVDQEVQRRMFDNVRYLYYYTTEPIDLTRVLVDPCTRCIQDPPALVKEMAKLRETVGFVNKQLEDVGNSFLANDRRLKDRMNLSEGILGQKRIEKYRIEDVYGSIFDLLMVKATGMDMESGYVYIMGFCSEFIMSEVGEEDAILHLKEYANGLLIKKEE
ncbi:hypothetical protein EHEL_040770 [Encephalitozoon hellem ATCC 50504]|uniref:Uncharacterized protein n=1 Tax=Encephalitozoon hellem TaxID=27973 RepID=A0A9Q9C5M9_ENCHE|nr:uncharacterized protein EHEL_040770 [Encephalitozoon hellem ATCC 50504]AFM98128.1 hypothetical protein EHEL_040770 [Encephalitozoon hellem ATCC 50504]UTX42972.1 hypothetical protein GPU96_04g07040 [Encephalitozoon hellem]|eukprot:XP_003887109.1 hypothetical protein EHEL_040770 [Encephalitozoon hellem ATCC 50504]